MPETETLTGRDGGVGSKGSHGVVRIEVRPLPSVGDPRGDAVLREANRLGFAPTSVRSASVYLLEGLRGDEAQRAIEELLVDGACEVGVLGESAVESGWRTAEVHPLPGVMDPAAGTVEFALRDILGIESSRRLRVSTARRYDIAGLSEAEVTGLARAVLFNPAIERVETSPWTPESFPELPAPDQTVRTVKVRGLSTEGLMALSREGHLFLDETEMEGLQAHFDAIGREPTDIELESLAQTWSEHCVHKTLKSRVHFQTTRTDDPIDWSAIPGAVVSDDGKTVEIPNLLKHTVAAATHELIAEGLDWTLSVFVDNSGVIRFDDDTAVCMKVETHNRPSAIEPYGGAATGIGGCIRDILGTGLGAKPIASTDVFCVADPRSWAPSGEMVLPSGVLHPRRVLTRVIDGVRDYGNRMGIPTLSGAVYFDDAYVGNPLVYVGCIGVLPPDMVGGAAEPGDLIVALGGRTGKDGIHGATFSSGELTSTHADEFAHAVQIGNAIEEKKVLDAILRARDAEGGPLFRAVTDCGAGGFSSAIGEMGEEVGATVELDKAPLKYSGLRYDEIWISESQERMVLAVPSDRLERLRAVCDEEGVELAVLGEFGAGGDTPELVLKFEGDEVGRLPMAFLHDGIPMPTKSAVDKPQVSSTATRGAMPSAEDLLHGLLAHPNIASKRWLIRQYDHEVQARTLAKPLVGRDSPGHAGPVGPGDAAIVEPSPGSPKGLSIACGLATRFGQDGVAGADAYLMALAAIDECVRNLVCVGTDPERIAILDNFCWASCNAPKNMASLTRASAGCYFGAKAYKAPFVSGKDSLNNQFRTTNDQGEAVTIEIPPTLLISGMGIVQDRTKRISMDAKIHQGGEPPELVLISAADPMWAPSHAALVSGAQLGDAVKPWDLARCVTASRFVAALIQEGVVEAAHDCSEGGLLVAIAEMLIAGYALDHPVGAALFIDAVMDGDDDARMLALFGEAPGRYVLQVPAGMGQAIVDRAEAAGVGGEALGILTDDGKLDLFKDLKSVWMSTTVPACREAFTGTLDW